MERDLYTEQLRTVLRDILAVAKPQLLWRGQIWEERVARAERLLKRRTPIGFKRRARWANTKMKFHFDR